MPLATMPLDDASVNRIGDRELVIVGIRPSYCHDATTAEGRDVTDRVEFTTRIDDVEWRGKTQLVYLGYELDAGGRGDAHRDRGRPRLRPVPELRRGRAARRARAARRHVGPHRRARERPSTSSTRRPARTSSHALMAARVRRPRRWIAAVWAAALRCRPTTTLALVRFDRFEPTSYDNAIFEQAISGYAHLQAPIVADQGPGLQPARRPLLADHRAARAGVPAVPGGADAPGGPGGADRRLGVRRHVAGPAPARLWAGGGIAVAYGLSFGLQSAVDVRLPRGRVRRTAARAGGRRVRRAALRTRGRLVAAVAAGQGGSRPHRRPDRPRAVAGRRASTRRLAGAGRRRRVPARGARHHSGVQPRGRLCVHRRVGGDRGLLATAARRPRAQAAHRRHDVRRRRVRGARLAVGAAGAADVRVAVRRRQPVLLGHRLPLLDPADGDRRGGRDRRDGPAPAAAPGGRGGGRRSRRRHAGELAARVTGRPRHLRPRRRGPTRPSASLPSSPTARASTPTSAS